MAEFSSPGVITQEIDYTARATILGTATGGTVGQFKWGAAGVEIPVSSEPELVATLGKPNDQNYRDWFCAANFLAYTSSLKLVRVINEETALNAAVGGVSPAILIKNSNHLEAIKLNGTVGANFVARCPGDLGNSIAVSIADSTTFATWAYADLFDSAPDSTRNTPVSNVPANDEVHIVITDVLGVFTGTPGTILEKFAYLSKAKDGASPDGNSVYYVNIINSQSAYVYAVTPLADTAVETDPLKAAWGQRISDDKAFLDLTVAYRGVLAGGADGDIPGKDEYLDAFGVLTSPDKTDVALLFAGGCGNDLNQPEISNFILTEASRRQDMLAFVSPKASDIVGKTKSAAVTAILATKEALTTKDSYGVITTGYKLQYDRYNDTNRWVPGNGDDAGLCAYTENNNDVWVSPAGYNRGAYRNCISLAFNPDQQSRDTLYKANINPVVTFPNDGTILYGDKTLQAKNSVFSFIGTRRLFNFLKITIRESSKYVLFENNTKFTRQQFKDVVEPILREIKGRDGVVDYFVRCDEFNNTDDVIQKGEFVANIIVKPQYSIQGIRLQFTAVRRETNFQEIV